MRRQSAPMYDLFKLIVALILLALIILMLLRPPSGSSAGVTPAGAASSSGTNPTEPAAVAVNTAAPSATAAVENNAEAEDTAVAEDTAAVVEAATATPTATIAPTIEPTSTPTLEPTAEAQVTPTLEATIAPTPGEAAAMPTATADTGSTTGQPADLAACAALPSRLAIGDNARVMTNLIFRSSPGIENNIIRTHLPGTVMEVTGGPECVPYQNGAYLWWELRHPDGTTGWSAEGSISSSNYFLQPVE